MSSSILGFTIWPGRSGKQYWYAIYPRHWRFGPRQPGNYIYAVESAASKLSPLYIGQTNDLNQRLLEQQSGFNLFRATHLCAHFNYYDYGACGRLAEERDLIELWQPVCNRSNQPSGAELLVPRLGRRLIASSSVMISNDCSPSASASFWDFSESSECSSTLVPHLMRKLSDRTKNRRNYRKPQSGVTDDTERETAIF